jgi:hypothetical protein
MSKMNVTVSWHGTQPSTVKLNAVLSYRFLSQAMAVPFARPPLTDGDRRRFFVGCPFRLFEYIQKFVDISTILKCSAFYLSINPLIQPVMTMPTVVSYLH